MHAEDSKIKDLTLKPTESKDDVKTIANDKSVTTYTYEEAYKSTLEYFKGDELAASVWINKYALKDSFGKIYERDPEQMHWRIAREIARIEQKYPNPLSLLEIHGVLKDFKYIVPQGSPMTGIGNNFQIASLSLD